MVKLKAITGAEIAAAFVAGAECWTRHPGSVGNCLPAGRAGDAAYIMFLDESYNSGWNTSFDMPLFLLFLAQKARTL